jgi:hypothetical protein
MNFILRLTLLAAVPVRLSSARQLAQLGVQVEMECSVYFTTYVFHNML